ncbi:MAG TPA: CcmD family protein [Dehalococcoidia bacterium]|nr:CcmD family protein [Dehalococcoidia bacterium]
MENSGYLFAAYTIIWAVVFGYVFFLYYKQRKLRRQMGLLEDSIGKRQNRNGSEASTESNHGE